MNDAISMLNYILQKFSQDYIEYNVKRINTSIVTIYENCSDDDLQNFCLERINGFFSESKQKEFSIFRNLVKFLNKILLRNTADEATIDLIALGAEAFARCPADLEKGSYLFNEQLAASIALTQNCIVQMNTGEGKTYAILPAAFALYCKYKKVYIICANEYLAARDATRTRNYYDFVGLNVGLAIDNQTNVDEWGKQIIYTTLSSFIFHHLRNVTELHKPFHPLKFDACIIDEADSVLLDQAWTEHILSRDIESNKFNWDIAFKYAKTLEPEHIKINEYYKDCTLTEKGEDLVQNELKENESNYSIHQYPLIRKSIELAYVALFLVKENKDYVIENQNIYPYDPITGKILRNQRVNWIIPLQILLNIESSTERKAIHRITPQALLKKFDHISGLSGTVSDDSLEYLLSHQFPTIILPPRVSRKGEIAEDAVFRTKREAHNGLVDEIINISINNKRPVLVGCQNIEEVQIVYRMLSLRIGSLNNINIYPIIGKDDENIAEIYLNGGNIGNIIISTQLSGRGVDIRLSEEAIQNGGLHLIALEHSQELRYDKQFLGRAGRQGQPFSASFYVSLEDDLLERFGSGNIRKVMEGMGMQEGEIIKHSMISGAILRSQKTLRENNFFNRMARQHAELRIETINDDFEKLISIFQDLNDNTFNINNLNDNFIDFLCMDFSKRHIEPFVSENNQDAFERFIKNVEIKIGIIFEKNFTNRIIDVDKKNRLVKIEKAIKNKILESINTKKQEIENSENRVKVLNDEKRNFKAALYKINRCLNVCNIPIEQQFIESTDIIPQEILFNIDNILADLERVEYEVNNELITIENINVEFIKYLLLYKNALTTSIDNISENVRKLNKSIDRSIRQTVSLTLFEKWNNFYDEKARIEKRLIQYNTNPLDYNRALGECLNDEWNKVQDSMSETVIKNIISSDVSFLDSLYYDLEHQAYSNSTAPNEKINWQSKINKPNLIANNDPNSELIRGFININRGELDKIYFTEKLELTLQCFLKEFPISTLRTTQNLLNAIESWNKKELFEYETIKKRRELNHFWLKRFLTYLYQKQLIAPLPNLLNSLNSKFKKVLKNILDIQILIPTVQILISIIIFFLVAKINIPTDKFDIHSFAYFFDTYFLGNFISNGIVVGSIIAGLLIVLRTISDSPIARYLSISFTSCLYIYYFWQSGTSLNLTISILFLFCLIPLSIFYFSIISNSRKLLGVDLLALWLIFAVSRGIVVTFGIISIETIIFVSIAILYTVWQKNNTVEIICSSHRLTHSAVSMKSENIRTGYIIKGMSSNPYLYSLILLVFFSFIFKENIAKSQYSTFILFGVFYVVLIVLSHFFIAKKCNLNFWKAKISNNNQILIDGNITDSIQQLVLKDELIRCKKRLFKKDIFFHLIILILVFLLFKTSYFATFPLFKGLIIISLSVIIGEQFDTLIQQLNRVFVNSIPSSFEVIDFSNIQEPKIDKSLLDKFKDLLEPATTIGSYLRIVTVIIVIALWIWGIIEKYWNN